MVNITNKVNSLRQAVANAVLKVSSIETIEAINNRAVPKGDVFEFSRAAGLLAIKKQVMLFLIVIHFPLNLQPSNITSRDLK